MKRKNNCRPIEIFLKTYETYCFGNAQPIIDLISRDFQYFLSLLYLDVLTGRSRIISAWKIVPFGNITSKSIPFQTPVEKGQFLSGKFLDSKLFSHNA